ncbi:unnamed protein product, partial [Schistosoma mattheei]
NSSIIISKENIFPGRINSGPIYSTANKQTLSNPSIIFSPKSFNPIRGKFSGSTWIRLIKLLGPSTRQSRRCKITFNNSTREFEFSVVPEGNTLEIIIINRPIKHNIWFHIS